LPNVTAVPAPVRLSAPVTLLDNVAVTDPVPVPEGSNTNSYVPLLGNAGSSSPPRRFENNGNESN
jgi:hypothetical protein